LGILIKASRAGGSSGVKGDRMQEIEIIDLHGGRKIEVSYINGVGYYDSLIISVYGSVKARVYSSTVGTLTAEFDLPAKVVE
jgi:hypothetical protein